MATAKTMDRIIGKWPTDLESSFVDSLICMSAHRVAILSEVPHLLDAIERAWADVEEDLPHIEYVSVDQPNTDILEAATILLGDPRLIAKVLHLCPLVQWIQSTWAGVEPLLPLPRIANKSIVLTKLSGVFGPLMAEFVLANVIAAERHFETIYRQNLTKIWKPYKKYRPLSECTMVIIGYGDIGRHIGKAAAAFGMKVRKKRRRKFAKKYQGVRNRHLRT